MRFRIVGTKTERHPKSVRPEFVERPFFLNVKGRTVLRQAQGERDWRDSSYFARVALGGHQTRIASHRSEEHTSELQSLMRISYAVFCLKQKNTKPKIVYTQQTKQKQ